MPAGLAVSQVLIGVDPDRADTVRQHPLGLELDFNDGTRRRYIRAGAAIAQYDALTYDSEGVFDWQPTSAADQPVKGVAPIALADNEFGWVITKGPANVKVAAAITAGAHLVSTATAGTLDDDGVPDATTAMAQAAGVGVTAQLDDTPSAGIALVFLS